MTWHMAPGIAEGNYRQGEAVGFTSHGVRQGKPSYHKGWCQLFALVCSKPACQLCKGPPTSVLRPPPDIAVCVCKPAEAVAFKDVAQGSYYDCTAVKPYIASTASSSFQ